MVAGAPAEPDDGRCELLAGGAGLAVTIDGFIARLGASAKRTGDGKWICHCPAHEDARRSLSVSQGAKGILLHCFAGCGVEQIAEALGLRVQDLFDRPAVPWAGLPPISSDRPSRLEATYEYRDKSGDVLFQVLRFAGKSFRQRRPDPDKPGAWVWNLKGVQLVPYRLPELLAAPPDEMTYLVEGEKDVETMVSHGLSTTTSPGGASRSSLWKNAAFNGPLRGRNVTIIPDNDVPGRDHARAVANALNGVVASVRILDLPGVPEKGDVSDWFEMGGTRAELVRITAACAVVHPGGESQEVDDGIDERGERQSQTQRIVELAQGAIDLFKTTEDEAFACIRRCDHQETRAVCSKQFRQYLIELFFRSEGRIPATNAISEAIATLEALAGMGDNVGRMDLRVATHGSACYLDLGSANWQVVEMSRDGWWTREASAIPVRFRRPRAMLPLPEPVPGGELVELRQFLNAGGDENWRLMVAWLTFAFQSQGPFPVLVVQGEQGSAKTTTSKVLRTLIDPSASELRMMPKDVQDLMVGAKNAWVLAYDNLSGMPPWLSDGLCILSTGGTFTTRALYTVDEETILRASRPVIVNGIDDMTTRPDLADRAVMVSLPTIAPERRREEGEFWVTFNAAKPRILGALCSAVAAGLRARSGVHLASRPRMADFAAWGVALECGLEWPPGSFLDAYQGNLAESASAALEADPVAMAVLGVVNNTEGPWEGTVSALLGELEKHVPPERRGRSWPRSPQSLTSRMRRAAPALRREGIDVSQPPRSKRAAFWTIREIAHPPESSPPSSPFEKSQCASGVGSAELDEKGGFKGGELQRRMANDGDVTAHQNEFATVSGPPSGRGGVEGVEGAEHCFPSRSGKSRSELRASPERLPAPSPGAGDGGSQ